MNLKLVHIVFVTFSTLLAFVMAGWSARAYSVQGGAVYVVLAVGSVLGGVGLIVYGFWFWRKITTREEERRRRRKKLQSLPALALVSFFSWRAAEACSVCYGEAEGPMIDAARMGVWLLFGMTFAVQGGFIAFFVYLARRARKYRTEKITPWWVESL